MATLIDLAFVIDTTGSMGDDIGAVRSSAADILDDLFGDPDADIDARVSIVGYNDPATEVVLPFTEEATPEERLAAVQAGLDSITAFGGGDTPEAVFGGLKTALDGSAGEWREEADVRKVVLFGDAPPKDTELRDEVIALAADASVDLGGADAELTPIPVGLCLVAVGEGAVKSFEEIADLTDGDLITTEDASTLVETLTTLVEDIVDDAETPEDPPVVPSGGVVDGSSENDLIVGPLDGTAYVDSDGDFVGDAGPEDNDTVLANEGDDLVFTGAGDDQMDGGPGNDTLTGGGGRDSIQGSNGDDVIRGNHGSDSLSGGAGNDFLGDWSGSSLLDGGEGDDTMSGGAGEDTLLGGDGTDSISGGGGEDTLIGGAGNDVLIGGRKGDTFQFGETDGEDTITDFEIGSDIISLTDYVFAGAEDEDGARSDAATFLSERAVIQDGSDLFVDLGDGHSLRLLDVVDEENIGEDEEDYVDIFFV